MEYNKKDIGEVCALFTAYTENIADLIDDMRHELRSDYRQELKRHCNAFYNFVHNNKMINGIINELHKGHGVNYNEYRDLKEKTMQSVLRLRPQSQYILTHIIRQLNEESPLLFTEKQMTEFAIHHQQSKSLSVTENYQSYLKNNNYFKDEK